MEEPGGTLLGNHTLRTRRITRKRLPQLRHRKACNSNVRRIESSMLLVCDSRVLCQPHRGQLGRSGSVTASTSSFSSMSSAGVSWSAYSDCCSGSLAISFVKPARSHQYQFRDGVPLGFGSGHDWIVRRVLSCPVLCRRSRQLAGRCRGRADRVGQLHRSRDHRRRNDLARDGLRIPEHSA